MTRDTAYCLADPDFYRAPEQATRGRELGTALAARPELAGWIRRSEGAWTTWAPSDEPAAAQGWKVHVAARAERLEAVLAAVAQTCAAHDVAFKHTRTDWLYGWQHHKHGDRTQSGKFCTAYPASEAAAEALMVALSAALADEEGPRPLTDRSFRGSGVVSYRFGSFVPRSRLQPDGTRVELVLDGTGQAVPDVRRAGFRLPTGLRDPFASVADPVTESTADSPRLGAYRFLRVLACANAGNAYLAVSDAGREVFVKQARPHNGLQWDGTTARERLLREHAVLVALQAVCPGLAPEPLDLLEAGGCLYLVTELVPGRTLWAWNALAHPLAATDERPAALAAHLRRCRGVLDRLRAELDRLHAAGWIFGDLNPGNVLVDEHDRPRLVDFEVADRLDGPLALHGAPGYLHPAAVDPSRSVDGPREYDDYGLAALTLMLLHPSHAVLDRNPAATAHLRAALPGVPADLWDRATRFRPTPARSDYPTPAEVAAEPDRWLGWLHDRAVSSLLAIDPALDRPVATVPSGLRVDPSGLAHGTAGVLHVLHRCGITTDPRLVDAVTRAAGAPDTDLAPGLLTGRAGLAWVLAEQGRSESARRALTAAAAHPLLDGEPSVSHGRAGVALAALALDRSDPDDRLVELADRVLRPALDPAATARAPHGWRYGATGVALAALRLAERRNDPALARDAVRLLSADLRYSRPVAGDGLLFHVSDDDRRVEPYVAAGSAGFVLVAQQLLDSPLVVAPEHDGLAVALAAATRSVAAGGACVAPGLFEGLGGLALVLAEARQPAPALRLARRLFAHVVPDSHGPVAFLGGPGGRLSADLATGTAGVLLAVDQILTGRTGGLLDPAPHPQPLAATPTSRRLPGEHHPPHHPPHYPPHRP